MAKRKRGANEGSIYRMKDGRWRAAVSLGWKDGKRVRKVLTGKTCGDVSERLKALLRSQQLGLPVAPEKQTVGHFLAQWLEDIAKPSVRPKTFRFYADLVNLHIAPKLGRIKLQKLSVNHVQSLLNDRPAFGLSPRTVRHVHRTLCTALTVAVKHGLVPRNLATLADPPRAPKPDIKFLDLKQARLLLDTAKEHPLHALFATILSLGLRLGEALGLSWSDVDLDSGRLTIRHALQRVDKKCVLVEPKSRSSHRTVILPAVAISALRHHRANQEQRRLLAGTGWKGNDWDLVFASRVGTPLSERNVLRTFKAILRRADLPNLRIHDLRHSAVAILIAQGVGARAISELIGHSAVGFTLQVYGHLMEETKRETAAKMDAALQPVATPVATQAAPTSVN